MWKKVEVLVKILLGWKKIEVLAKIPQVWKKLEVSSLSDDAAGDLQIFGTLFSCILIFFEKSLILVFSSYLVHFW